MGSLGNPQGSLNEARRYADCADARGCCLHGLDRREATSLAAWPCLDGDRQAGFRTKDNHGSRLSGSYWKSQQHQDSPLPLSCCVR